MIIFKKKRVPKDNFPPKVIVRANEKGWMNHELMKTWLLEVWNKRKRCVNDPSQSLLILDSARCHLTEDVRELFKEHSKIAVIPGGMTKYLQPLDVGINKPFKDNLRAGWERWMADAARARYTKGGFADEFGRIPSSNFGHQTSQPYSSSFKRFTGQAPEPVLDTETDECRHSSLGRPRTCGCGRRASDDGDIVPEMNLSGKSRTGIYNMLVMQMNKE
ncbi:unnamed protein product [Cylicocyclus nassatus]|uniref:DDE-1 domain-containing protein n=1 Tax=Cylicocyclus nassatus TaxID=53992 RepID=A0AA36DU58_CYLNA|nr:unnamed protein product [Cylicocyclus nassatus]